MCAYFLCHRHGQQSKGSPKRPLLIKALRVLQIHCLALRTTESDTNKLMETFLELPYIFICII